MSLSTAVVVIGIVLFVGMLIGAWITARVRVVNNLIDSLFAPRHTALPTFDRKVKESDPAMLYTWPPDSDYEPARKDWR